MDTSGDVAASTTNHHTTVGDFATASGDAYEAWDESEDERLSTAVSSTEGFSEGLATTARDVKSRELVLAVGPRTAVKRRAPVAPRPVTKRTRQTQGSRQSDGFDSEGHGRQQGRLKSRGARNARATQRNAYRDQPRATTDENGVQMWIVGFKTVGVLVAARRTDGTLLKPLDRLALYRRVKTTSGRVT
ncbi:hypothetical protein GN958_ATG08887 [Phytophthora infestans]|uniref:Uncharacterized protein n=1 Tax=Phytophthora infestans TaxID=4787 RepID=A0A8S9UUW4_PHYIN|nr:hypothetical protein GN958_ATG08887 [Phytophthora infestans]